MTTTLKQQVQFDTHGDEMADWLGAGIIETLEDTLKKFMVLPSRAVLPLALWILSTHCFRLFQALAYIAVGSPTWGCGKTRFLELCAMLVAEPEFTSGVSEAVLFRLIDSRGPTLLIDEAEVLSGKDDRAGYLRHVLNAGNRADATVTRCNRGSFEPEHFHVYCPKMIACVGTLPPTLVSRSIVILLQKKTKSQKLSRFIKHRVQADCEGLREACHEWITENSEEIVRVYEGLPELDFLPDRDAEGWEPLFAILSVAVPHRLPELRRCAESLTQQKIADTEDDNLSLRLLADIRAVWSRNEPRVTTSTLLTRLRVLEESPWAEEVPLNQRKLARMLRPFNVTPKQMRIGAGNCKGYEYSALSQVFSRYLSPVSETSETGLENE